MSVGSLIFVRLFRLWSAARAGGSNPVPAMQELLHLFEPAPELAVASASLFDLVEAHLGRPLVPECCCGRELSRDEKALLGVLRHAPEAGQPMGSTAIPHGLPGAICWAAFAVRRALAASFGPSCGEAPEVQRAEPPRECPFAPAPAFFASAARTGAAAGTN